jgi:hypothetical protein
LLAVGFVRTVSSCEAIFRKFLSLPLEYIPLRVLSFPVPMTTTVTLLVSDDKGLISFHEMLCPMLLFLDTWTEVIFSEFSSSVSYTGVRYFQRRVKNFVP